MDYEGYTFVFLSKYKQDFFIKIYIYYALTFQRLKILFKMQVSFISLIKLKGSNFTPYYLLLMWIEWNISILFIKSKKT